MSPYMQQWAKLEVHAIIRFAKVKCVESRCELPAGGSVWRTCNELAE